MAKTGAPLISLFLVVLAIIEDYMMVEYVDLPKGSDTWPFLKRWWIVVAKLTENIVCWFPIEFMLYTSMLWWTATYSWEVYDKSFMLKFVVVIIIHMMLLCPYFVLSTPLSLSMWTCFRFRFSLEDKRGLSLGELIRPFCIRFSYCHLQCFYP